jgi:hypothetical protein
MSREAAAIKSFVGAVREPPLRLTIAYRLLPNA